MNLTPLIAARTLNVPLLLLPAKLAIITTVLEDRIQVDAEALRDLAALAPPSPEASRYVGQFELIDPNNPQAGRKPYRTAAGGVAIIPVVGSLVNRGSFLDALSGIESYERISFMIRTAATDRDVRAIILDIDSPGGEAVGAFEVADVIREVSATKTVIAVANGLCCSAAFGIASAATRVVVSPSSIVGSIGVVLLHVDHSRRIDRAGMTPTLIHVGARKVDGNPYEPLADDVRSELESEIERFMTLFVACVARGRRMTPKAIRETEARTFIGADAVSAGLADEIGTIHSVLATYAALYGARVPRIASTDRLLIQSA